MNNVDSINRQILELNHRKKKLELEIIGIDSTIQFLREQKQLLEGVKGTNQITYDDLLSD
tara:strand:+ start:538 stop:717 length:180 start_codon:yes stop_codon:yes gene_type:complete